VSEVFDVSVFHILFLFCNSRDLGFVYAKMTYTCCGFRFCGFSLCSRFFSPESSLRGS